MEVAENLAAADTAESATRPQNKNDEVSTTSAKILALKEPEPESSHKAGWGGDYELP
jgi:hypothetical protein